MLKAIAAPVEAAHKQGILHRDLKPENILLPEDGVDAKVLDFGIAKVLSAPTESDSQTVATLTAFGQPLGTPAYMAPEQLAGEEMTVRTDVYALGVIGYELRDRRAAVRPGLVRRDRDAPAERRTGTGRGICRTACAAAIAAALSEGSGGAAGLRRARSRRASEQPDAHRSRSESQAREACTALIRLSSSASACWSCALRAS